MSIDHPFEHVVCLMMENQSFDRLLGFVEGIGALTGEEFALNSEGEKVYVSKGLHTIENQKFDPPHSTMATISQLWGPEGYHGQAPSGEWMLSSQIPEPNPTLEKQFMQGCDMDLQQLPAIATLAKNYIICDRWFSSVPGPTSPNRMFVHAATSGGYAGSDYEGHKFSCPREMRTIFESIDNKGGLDWRYYFATNLDTALAFPHVKERTGQHFRLNQFFKDAKSGDLPAYSFLSPELMVDCQHPGELGINLVPGDNLIADVYEALRSNEDIWRKVLFIVTYDEAGGYWDSVVCQEEVPTVANEYPDWNWPGQVEGYDFKYLGVRIPSLIISPWFDHKIDHNIYEHASVPATLKEVFDLKSHGPDGFLTRRDQHADNLLENNVFRGTPRDDLKTLPRSKHP